MLQNPPSACFTMSTFGPLQKFRRTLVASGALIRTSTLPAPSTRVYGAPQTLVSAGLESLESFAEPRLAASRRAHPRCFISCLLFNERNDTARCATSSSRAGSVNERLALFQSVCVTAGRSTVPMAWRACPPALPGRHPSLQSRAERRLRRPRLPPAPSPLGPLSPRALAGWRCPRRGDLFVWVGFSLHESWNTLLQAPNASWSVSSDIVSRSPGSLPE